MLTGQILAPIIQDWLVDVKHSKNQGTCHAPASGVLVAVIYISADAYNSYGAVIMTGGTLRDCRFIRHTHLALMC